MKNALLQHSVADVKSDKCTLSSCAKQARSCLNDDFAICVSKTSKIFTSYIVSYSVVKMCCKMFTYLQKVGLSLKFSFI